jgi:hypothetical protein
MKWIKVELLGGYRLGGLDAWRLHIPEKLTPVSDQDSSLASQLN